MKPSSFVPLIDAHLSSALAGKCAFSLPEAPGEFDRHACARFYGDVIEGRLLYLGLSKSSYSAKKNLKEIWRAS